MAKQLDFLPQGKVIPTALHSEMQQSYLEYAMSVIVGRALPDVRDGLKPVHRRILYAMHELGLTPDRPFRKCARVVGDVLGKYHPHGDQAVYDALVRMVQAFSSRYPLLEGHGNFGSVDNDPPAAMRYTETRLSTLGNEAILGEIGEATVDFIGNFDNSQQEPVVVPAQLPNLLLNGCSGIAVGMATNIPPHNLGEIVDALIALIDRPDLPQEQLLTLVPGPDFPTGGQIIGQDGIQEAYGSGRGSITLRGIAQIEEIQPGRGRHRRPALIVTELPYQVNKAGWIEKMADLINRGHLEGIADIRDESDRTGMRVVIELKREANPQVVLEQLYRQTPLQTNFGAILLALVDGQPRQLSLREMLQAFLDFREQTLTRRYTNELEQAQSRQHLVEGLLTALADLDGVIDLLRAAADGPTAKVELQHRFDLSDRQADAILAMPLRRLTGLERRNLQTEFEDLCRQIQELQTLLGNRKERLKALKKDLRALKRRHGDARRTQIVAEAPVLLPPEELVEEGPVLLEVSQKGYIRRSKLSSKSRRLLEANGDANLEAIKDPTIDLQSSRLSADLLVFTSGGKAYTLGIQEIPAGDRRARGTPLIALLPDSAQGEQVVTQFARLDYPESEQVIALTRQGRIKRLPLSEFAGLTARGLNILKLKEDDQLGWVGLGELDAEIAVATSAGRLLRLPLADLPLMGRTALGLQALRLGRQDAIVGLVALRPDQNLLLVSQQGFVKRMPFSALPLTQPGGIGTPAFQFAEKRDRLAAIAADPERPAVLQILTDTERAASLAIASIPLWGKDGAGSQLFSVKRGEKVQTAVVLTPDQLEDPET